MGRLVAALAAALAQPELIPDTPEHRNREPNPCRRLYGPGPGDRTCRSCVHLYAAGGYKRTFWKCDLRHASRCAATDHRTGWRACAHFSQAASRPPGR